jgi:hypothetical protein
VCHPILRNNTSLQASNRLPYSIVGVKYLGTDDVTNNSRPCYSSQTSLSTSTLSFFANNPNRYLATKANPLTWTRLKALRSAQKAVGEQLLANLQHYRACWRGADKQIKIQRSTASSFRSFPTPSYRDFGPNAFHEVEPIVTCPSRENSQSLYVGGVPSVVHAVVPFCTSYGSIGIRQRKHPLYRRICPPFQEKAHRQYVKGHEEAAAA